MELDSSPCPVLGFCDFRLLESSVPEYLTKEEIVN